MITQSFTLVANTALLALSGRWVIQQVVYNTGAAGTLNIYDNGVAAITQSNPAYDTRTRDCSYSRTVEDVRDIACNTIDYTFSGISDTDTTVAADASFALPVKESLGLPAAGQVSTNTLLNFALGVVLQSTVNATVQLTYKQAAA